MNDNVTVKTALPTALCRKDFFYRYLVKKVSANVAAIYEYSKSFNLHLKEFDGLPRQNTRCICMTDAEQLQELKEFCNKLNEEREKETERIMLELWNKDYKGTAR